MMKPSALEALFRLQQIDVALAELAQKAQTSDRLRRSPKPRRGSSLGAAS